MDRASRSEHSLNERIRRWEDYHEESKRRTSRDDEEDRPTRDEPTNGHRDDLVRKLARA